MTLPHRDTQRLTHGNHALSGCRLLELISLNMDSPPLAPSFRAKFGLTLMGFVYHRKLPRASVSRFVQLQYFYLPSTRPLALQNDSDSERNDDALTDTIPDDDFADEPQIGIISGPTLHLSEEAPNETPGIPHGTLGAPGETPAAPIEGKGDPNHKMPNFRRQSKETFLPPLGPTPNQLHPPQGFPNHGAQGHQDSHWDRMEGMLWELAESVSLGTSGPDRLAEASCGGSVKVEEKIDAMAVAYERLNHLSVTFFGSPLTLYGSSATGFASKTSDVDVVANLSPERIREVVAEAKACRDEQGVDLNPFPSQAQNGWAPSVSDRMCIV